MSAELVKVRSRIEGLKLLNDSKVDGFAADRTRRHKEVAELGYVWVVRADGSEVPRIYIPNALSPAVVRS